MNTTITTQELIAAHRGDLSSATWDDPRPVERQLSEDAPAATWLVVEEGMYATAYIGQASPCVLFLPDESGPQMYKEAEAEEVLAEYGLPVADLREACA